MESIPKLGIKDIRYLVRLPKEERLGAIIKLNETERFRHRIDVIKTLNDIDRLCDRTGYGKGMGWSASA